MQCRAKQSNAKRRYRSSEGTILSGATKQAIKQLGAISGNQLLTLTSQRLLISPSRQANTTARQPAPVTVAQGMFGKLKEDVTVAFSGTVTLWITYLPVYLLKT